MLTKLLHLFEFRFLDLDC